MSVLISKLLAYGFSAYKRVITILSFRIAANVENVKYLIINLTTFYFNFVLFNMFFFIDWRRD